MYLIRAALQVCVGSVPRVSGMIEGHLYGLFLTTHASIAYTFYFTDKSLKSSLALRDLQPCIGRLFEKKSLPNSRLNVKKIDFNQR